MNTSVRKVLAEVRGLEDVAEALKNVVFDEGDNVKEWSFEIVPVQDRVIEHGINWDWYLTDTKDDAKEWFEAITGAVPYESTIFAWEGKWAFRLHK
jgi:hypothetical protein